MTENIRVPGLPSLFLTQVPDVDVALPAVYSSVYPRSAGLANIGMFVFTVAVVFYGLASVPQDLLGSSTLESFAADLLSLVLCGLAVFWGVVFSLWLWQDVITVQRRKGRVTVDRRGFHDRALTSQPIAWSDMQHVSMTFSKGGGFLIAIELKQAPTGLATLPLLFLAKLGRIKKRLIVGIYDDGAEGFSVSGLVGALCRDNGVTCFPKIGDALL